MDTFALAAANALVGNDLGAACLEWALAGGSLRVEKECALAMCGATAVATLAGIPIPPLTTVHANPGEELIIQRIESGRFLYLAFSGGIDVPEILGSRSSYLPGGFGGHEGRTLKSGDALRLGDAVGPIPRAGFRCPPELAPLYGSGVAHVTRGTQADLFTEEAWRPLLDEEFRISATSDRTGYRLEGASLSHSMGALPSEASCFGAVQVPTDGKPIVLMADSPTVGGYPKIAVVSDADLPILAQRSPGQTIRFELVTIEQSQRALKRRASDLETLERLARTDGSRPV